MPAASTRPRQPIAAAIALTGLLAGAAWAAPERIVAIGDVHGAYSELVGILRTAGLVDAATDWSGGASRLVQTGDFTDRGSGVRDAIELLMKIERQATAQGGAVHVLLGNHEVMNLVFSDRDAVINPDIFASFADDRSQARRQAAFDDWQKWRRRRLQVQERAEVEFEPSPELRAFFEQDREAWLGAHPPGLVEYREAFAANGTYGRWLRALPVMVKLGDTLFLHGGIGPEFQDRTLEEINRLHRQRLEEWADDRKKLEKRRLVLPYFSWEETRLALEHQLYFPTSAADRSLAAEAWDRLNLVLADLFSEGSPLWYRGYAPAPLGLADEALAALLDRTDATYGVRRTVAGHTPLPDHSILSRLGGRLYLIDTGMLAPVYGGRASALEISLAGVSTVYPGAGREAASLGTNGGGTHPPAAAAVTARPAGRLFYDPDGSPLPFQELEEVERFLLEAAPLSQAPVGEGKTGAIRVLLERDATRARAIFHSIHDTRGSPTRPVVLDDGTKQMYFRDSYQGQIAAYELSKLLGMRNVPPAVARKIGGKRGSLALWIENGINLFGWRARGESDPSAPHFVQQLQDMRIFDNLIHNTDRNSQNIFWSGDFELWLIDHTRTLAQSRSLIRPERVRRCSRGMFDALRRLDPELVRARLGPYISSFEVTALLKRREKILEILEQRIAELGEEMVIFEYGQGPPASYSEPID